MPEIIIRQFERKHQGAVRTLILAGLKERFGWLDPSLNPDLDDIWSNYPDIGSEFLLVFAGDELIGTGALVRETADTGRIVRMSIASNWRRLGIGQILTRHLISLGRERGYTRIVLETNDDWHSAIQLYMRCGFAPYDHRNGEIHMVLELERDSRPT